MPTPFFSVIIPAYNQSRYFAQALQSVLDQTFHDWEILVVDDGSRPEEAEKIMRVVQDAQRRAPHATISFRRQDNQGVSVARNVSVKYAKASWLAFLDNDDLWRPTMLEDVHRVLERAQSEGKNDVALCHTDFVYIDGEGEEICAGFGRAINYLEFLAGNFPIFPCCSFVSKAAFEHIGGFDPMYPLAQDLDFYLKIFARNLRVEFLDSPLALYRAHGQNVSKNYRGSHREIAHILQKHLIHGLNYHNYEVAHAARKGLLRIKQTYGEQSVTASIRSLQERQLVASLTHAGYALRVHPQSLYEGVANGLKRKVRKES